MYYNFIIVNLSHMSFTISLMTKYTTTVSCLCQPCLQSLLSLAYLHTMIVTGHIQQITSLIL